MGAVQASAEYFVMPPELYRGYLIGLQKAREVLTELRALHVAHWRETEELYLNSPMDVDYDAYLDLERRGRLVLFTLRDEEKQVVGNLVYTLTFSQNQKQRMLAEERAFFVAKDHRRGALALRLLDYSERVLRDLGVNCITMSDKSPAGGASVEPLVRRRGYQPAAMTYVKELEN